MRAKPVIDAAGSTVTVSDINDPSGVGEHVGLIRQDAVQLRSGRLRARRVTVRLGSCVVVYHSTNLAIRTRPTLQAGLAAFVVSGPGACGTVNGLSVGPGKILACAPGTEVEFVVAAGYQSMSFMVPPDELRAHLPAAPGAGESPFPSGIEMLQSSDAETSSLFDWGRRITERAARTPDVFESPQVRSIARIELFEMLHAAIGLPVDVELGARDRTRAAHSRMVQHAEDHALTHSAGPLYLADLCRAAGVSERTLQYAFQDVMEMSPVAYLARLRLHQVRRALREAKPRSTTVTREAMKWGFRHFGEFSRAYRECFGELPSETLRRKSEAGSGPMISR